MDQADSEEARRLMQLEYSTAQASIANVDGQRFRIKEWAVTVAGALLALAVNSHSWSLGVIATTAVLFFAYIDIMYMEIQQRVINRSNDLEKCMEAVRRGDLAAADSYTFGIGGVFFGRHPWRELPSRLRERPQMIVFYIGLTLSAGLVTLLLALTM
jgi:hypothetical protein